MIIIQYPLGQLQANCYFLIRDKECLIIDPADEAGFILEELQRGNLTPTGMVATHGHFDHIMVAGEIQRSFNAPLYIGKQDIFLINRLIETAEHFLGYKPTILRPTNIRFLEEKTLQVSSYKLQVLYTPGHTPGSCCFYLPEEKAIFTGDTLFKNGVGRYDHSYSSKSDLEKSLRKILLLPSNTRVYPGHGEMTKIGNEI